MADRRSPGAPPEAGIPLPAEDCPVHVRADEFLGRHRSQPWRASRFSYSRSASLVTWSPGRAVAGGGVQFSWMNSRTRCRNASWSGLNVNSTAGLPVMTGSMAGDRSARTPPDRNSERRRAAPGEVVESGGGRGPACRDAGPAKDLLGIHRQRLVPRLRTRHSQRSAGKYPPPISRFNTCSPVHLLRIHDNNATTQRKTLRDSPFRPASSAFASTIRPMSCPSGPGAGSPRR